MCAYNKPYGTRTEHYLTNLLCMFIPKHDEQLKTVNNWTEHIVTVTCWALANIEQFMYLKKKNFIYVIFFRISSWNSNEKNV